MSDPSLQISEAESIKSFVYDVHIYIWEHIKKFNSDNQSKLNN
jgi:hypothetical protein